jgi:hypothetical protein
LILTLTKGANAVDLTTAPYSLIAEDIDLGGVTRDPSYDATPTADLAVFKATRTNEPRRIPLSVWVRESDADTLAASVNALISCLPDDSTTATLTVGATGASGTVEATARAVDGLVEKPYTKLEDGHCIGRVSFTLACDPWLLSPTDTLYSASAVTLPCVLDLSAMQGQHAAPLDLVLNATTANLHQVVAGVYPDDSAVIADFVHEAATLTWSGGAAAADTNGYPDGTGNTVWSTNSAAGVYTDLDVTDYLPGTYAIYANVARQSAASPATIATAYTTAVAIEGTDLRRHLLGYVALPCSTVRASATSSLRVTLTSDGTDYVYCNTIEVIPASWGIAGWHHSTTSSSADELRWADDVVYADDVASLAYATDDRALSAFGGALVVTGEGTTEAATLAVTATIDYDPRWEQLPGV